MNDIFRKVQCTLGFGTVLGTVYRTVYLRWFSILIVAGVSAFTIGQEDLSPVVLESIPIREELKLFVSAAALHPSGDSTAFATTRGEIWILDHSSEPGKWARFAYGLDRPDRLNWKDGNLIVRQRNETTQLRDTDNNGAADLYLATDSKTMEKPPEISPFKGINWLEGPRKTGVLAGQYFGGSQIANHLVRLSIAEDPRGSHYSLFVFHKGLIFPAETITRFGNDSWLIAQTNRTDPKRTRLKFAFQKLTWVDEATRVPFEVKTIQATEKGFRLQFTKELLSGSAGYEWSYRIESLRESKVIPITSVTLDETNQSVDLGCDEPPQAGVIYRIACEGVWSFDRDPVLNPSGLFVFKESPKP